MDNQYDYTPLFTPWRYVTSRKTKHMSAAFIIAANEVFVGKVYGHQGQQAKYIARRICEAMNRYADDNPHNRMFHDLPFAKGPFSQ